MNPRTTHLKIKLKTLTAETKIIRAEERKALQNPKQFKDSGYNPMFEGLRDHRLSVVKTYSRSNHLAYGFLLDHKYQEMERYCKEEPNFTEVQKIVVAFGGDSTLFHTWYSDAIVYLNTKEK